MLPDKGVLPLLGGEVGVQVLQLLRGDEGHLTGQLRQDGQLGEHRAQEGLGVPQRAHNGPDGVLQIVQIAVLGGDDLLPVPLVHIAEWRLSRSSSGGWHSCRCTGLAGVELIALQSQTLPLGQRVDHHAVSDTPRMSKATGRSTPFRSSFRPEDLATNRGAETRWRRRRR